MYGKDVAVGSWFFFCCILFCAAIEKRLLSKRIDGAACYLPILGLIAALTRLPVCVDRQIAIDTPSPPSVVLGAVMSLQDVF